MPTSNFKTLLFLGTAIMLSACGQAENTADKATETAAAATEAVAKTMKEKTTTISILKRFWAKKP